MTRALPLAMLFVFVASSPAAAGGVNLYWNECVGDGGVSNKTFACTASTAWASAIGSFVLNQPLPDFVAVELWIDVRTAAASVPPWWNFNPNPNACHGNSLAMTFDFSPYANTTCADPFGEPATGGLANYTTYLNQGEIIGVGAVPAPRALDAGVEYYGCRVAIRMDKATGLGACAGCGDAATITLRKLRAVGQATGSYEDNTAAISSACVNWNPTPSFNCSGATPAANTTWGLVKSLYR